MKKIKERRQGRVLVVELTFQSMLGDVRRHRGVWPKQSEKVHRHPGHTLRVGNPHPIQIGRGKAQRGLLPKADGIFVRGNGESNARQVRALSFQQSYRQKKIKGVRALEQLVDQRIWRITIRVGHRTISPRCLVRTTVSVKEFKETYFAKNCSSTAPS